MRRAPYLSRRGSSDLWFYASPLRLPPAQSPIVSILYFELALFPSNHQRGFKCHFRTNPTAKTFSIVIVDSIIDAIARPWG